MARESTNGHPQRLPSFNFLRQCYFCNIFLQKFSLQTLTKYEVVKTGSCFGIFAFDRCEVPSNMTLVSLIAQGFDWLK